MSLWESWPLIGRPLAVLWLALHHACQPPFSVSILTFILCSTSILRGHAGYYAELLLLWNPLRLLFKCLYEHDVMTRMWWLRCAVPMIWWIVLLNSPRDPASPSCGTKYLPPTTLKLVENPGKVVLLTSTSPTILAFVMNVYQYQWTSPTISMLFRSSAIFVTNLGSRGGIDKTGMKLMLYWGEGRKVNLWWG